MKFTIFIVNFIGGVFEMLTLEVIPFLTQGQSELEASLDCVSFPQSISNACLCILNVTATFCLQIKFDWFPVLHISLNLS